jgi:hypothetical protein
MTEQSHQISRELSVRVKNGFRRRQIGAQLAVTYRPFMRDT